MVTAGLISLPICIFYANKVVAKVRMKIEKMMRTLQCVDEDSDSNDDGRPFTRMKMEI